MDAEHAEERGLRRQVRFWRSLTVLLLAGVVCLFVLNRVQAYRFEAWVWRLSESEMAREHSWRRMVTEVQRAYGMKGGGGSTPAREDPELAKPQRLEAIQRARTDTSQSRPSMSAAPAPIE